jgi:uncharacterized protein YndB with AHSA1/START domain
MQDQAIRAGEAHRIATDTLRLERVLPGPPELIWAYLVDGEKRAKWFSGGTTMSTRGQAATLHFQHSNITDEPTPERWKAMDNGGFTSEVTVIELEQPKLLTYTWPEGDDISEVSFELSQKGKDTKLVLTHRRIGSVALMASFASGWHAHLDALAQVLDGRKPADFWTNVLRLDDKYAAEIGGRT